MDSAQVLRMSGQTRDVTANPSRETKLSVSNMDGENINFFSHLTKSRVDNPSWSILTLLDVCMVIAYSRI